MSKGNLFVGNGRGKVGNIVLSTLHGEQVTKAYQPVVSNPKTYGQLQQRAKFANAVKFFQRAISNFFAFAYEDKRKTESDYNAFMRHNVKYSCVVNRENYLDINFPALGNNWQLSQGSLTFPVSISFASYANIILNVNGETLGTTETATIGAISKLLVKAGLEEGDIFTIVYITKSGMGVRKATDVDTPPQWSIMQFIVNTTSVQLLSNVATKGALSAADGFYLQTDSANSAFSFAGGQNIVPEPGTFLENPNLAWVGLVITRKTTSGLKATISYLVPNQQAQQYETMLDGEDSLATNIPTWKNEGTSNSTNVILKGGVADGLASGSEATGTSDDANGAITSVNGSTTIPAALNEAASTTEAQEVDIVGVNLDKLVPSGVNVNNIHYEYNTLKTEMKLYFRVTDITKSFSVSLGSTVVAKWDAPSD